VIFAKYEAHSGIPDETLRKGINKGRCHRPKSLKMWKEGIRIGVLEIRNVTALQQ
jgi:hypothetical protein